MSIRFTHTHAHTHTHTYIVSVFPSAIVLTGLHVCIQERYLQHYSNFLQSAQNWIIVAVWRIYASVAYDISGLDGLSPVRWQAITWTNAGLLIIGPLVTNFNEIWIEIETVSFGKIQLKISSAKMATIWSRPHAVCEHTGFHNSSRMMCSGTPRGIGCNGTKKDTITAMVPWKYENIMQFQSNICYYWYLSGFLSFSSSSDQYAHCLLHIGFM